MSDGFSVTSLIDRLPRVRGPYTPFAPLNKVCWFRVGGPAEVLYEPADAEDLAAFLSRKAVNIPAVVLGLGSNVLVRDGGIPGVVIRLGRAFGEVAVRKTEITAGAAAPDLRVAMAARDASLTGFEFLNGIPGTIGGAIRMNAGAFGREMKDVVESVRAVSPDGAIRDLGAAELGFSYRACRVPEGWVFVSARLRGTPGPQAEIERRMQQIHAAREANQPLRIPSAGCAFKNPPNREAWRLVDQAGCRGLAIGGACISEKHANFIVNTGTATATDIEALGDEVRRRVKEATGVDLEWEIRRIGIPEEEGGKGRRR